jgi:hypothetical protein
MRLFGAIEKFDKRDDGSLLVSGIASSDSLDNEGQQITADAMKAALPDYMRFGNVREMHDDHSAAGVCLAADVMPDGKTRIETLIVDPVAVKKVIAGVYKGFSIGGEPLSVQGKAITRLRLNEISLCDRPVNPECRLDLWKATKAYKEKHMGDGFSSRNPDGYDGGIESGTDKPEIKDKYHDKDGKLKKSPVMIDSKKLAKHLGLPEHATEEEIFAALGKEGHSHDYRGDGVHPENAIAKALKSLGLDKIGEQMQALEAKMEAGNKEVLAKAEKSERVALVEQAGREGKVIPLDDDTIYGNAEKKVEAISLSALKTIVAKAQKSVSVSSKAAKVVQAGEKTTNIFELRKTGFENRGDRQKLTKAAKSKTPDYWNAFFAKAGLELEPQN